MLPDCGTDGGETTRRPEHEVADRARDGGARAEPSTDEVATEPLHPAPPIESAGGDSALGEAAIFHEAGPADVAEDVDAPEVVPPPAIQPVAELEDLDWDAVRAAVAPSAVRARIRRTVDRLEQLLDREGGPGLLFDWDREHPTDRAIRIDALDETAPLWFIGDLHGDLLALEAALAAIRATERDGPRPRLVFLGDLFDDGGFGLEVLLRVFELISEDPESICVVAGNHDVGLEYDGARFRATVSPSDFADFLNDHLAHEWVVRAGKLAVRLFANAPRALFFPDGLLVAHGGFPLADLHAELVEHADWNRPACLSDFVWTRAHPKARRKMPNRASRGSQFGYEDFAAFCAVATQLGRPVTHMIRGHDHVEERWAIPSAYAAHPVLTTVALSRRLDREPFGPYERVPTIARWVAGAVPQVHRLHVPGALVREIFPPQDAEEDEAQ